MSLFPLSLTSSFHSRSFHNADHLNWTGPRYSLSLHWSQAGLEDTRRRRSLEVHLKYYLRIGSYVFMCGLVNDTESTILNPRRLMTVSLCFSDLAITAVDLIRELYGWLSLWISALDSNLLCHSMRMWFSPTKSLQLAVLASTLALRSQAQCPDYTSYSQVRLAFIIEKF